MDSLEEHRSKLTVFYSLNTGKVKCYCGGIQDMNYFGDDKEDYNYDYIVVDYDNFIIRNFENFKVVDKTLIFEQVDAIKYKL